MNTLKVIQLDAPEILSKNLGEIYNCIERFGYCLLQAWDTEGETLRIIAETFGNLQSHVRSGKEGVVGLGANVFSGEWKEFIDEYRGVASNEEFATHTDASFLQGMYLQEGVMRLISPPKIMLLQCVVPAEGGGGNVLVDEQEVLSDILINEPDLASILSVPGCACFCRDDQIALKVAVYEKIYNGNYSVRFRFDQALYSPSWSLRYLETLHNKYHLNRKYRINITLAPGEILIVDNRRVLHGREEIIGTKRQFRRAWVNNDLPVLRNVAGKTRMHRALSQYAAYASIGTSHKVPSLNIGIKLSPGLSELMDSFIMKAALWSPPDEPTE
jgi:alpha-ketoglutarate-dependent taurine dioxygenase